MTAGLLKHDVLVTRAVTAIYNAQTADEKNGKYTNWDNKVGFNRSDAKFGCSLAEQLAKGKTLSPKQLAAARRMMIKYRSQLAFQANCKLAVAVAEGLAGLVAYAASVQDEQVATAA